MTRTIPRISLIVVRWVGSHWHWPALLALVLCSLRMEGLPALAAGVIGILLITEGLSRIVARFADIPSPSLLLVLWSLWIVGLYVWIACHAFPNSQFGSNQGFCFSTIPHSYYDRLTLGLLNGRLDLGVNPSGQLAALQDPYPPASREHGMYLYDASYYGGKYYSYFGITPALLLLPFFKVTGLFFPGSLAAALFCSLGYLFSLLCLLELWGIHAGSDSPPPLAGNRFQGGPLASPVAATCTALFLGMGNFCPFMLQVPFVYETAISSGFCCSMGAAFALAKVWRNRCHTRRCCLWLALSGLSLGLAIGSRPSLIIAGILALVLLYHLFKVRLLNATRLLCLALPYAASGFLLALYNHLRFGCFYEFGRRYQLSDESHVQGNLCFEDLSSRITDYLLLPPKFTTSFPHVVFRWEWNVPAPLDSRIEGPVIGIFPFLPAVALLPVLFLRGRGPSEPFVRSFLPALLACFFFLFVVDASVGQNSRYLVDFLPFLLIPATFAGFDSVSRSEGWKKKGCSLFLAISTLWTAGMVFLASRPESSGIRLDETISHFRKTAERHPDDPLLHNYLGLYLSQRGDREESMREYRRTVSLDPLCAEAWNNLGTQLWSSGSHEEALHNYRQAVILQPDYFDALNNLGTVLLLKGEADEALPNLERALERNPDSAEVHYNLAQVFQRKGRTHEAQTHLLRCLGIYPGYTEAHNLLASLFFNERNYPAAVREFEIALDLDRENTFIANNLAWILAAGPDRSQRDGPRALLLAKRLNGIEGNSRPSHLRTLAAAQAQCGDFSTAIRTAETALDLARTQGNPSVAEALQTDMGFYHRNAPLPTEP
jgi:tetratricopeptide (TPR) repeat protein